MTTTYRVVIKGVAVDQSIAGVAATLGPAFKISKERAIAVLQAPTFIVKQGLDLSAAARFEAALTKLGCVCIVEPEHPGQTQESTPTTHQEVQSAVSDSGPAQLAKTANTSAQDPETGDRAKGNSVSLKAWLAAGAVAIVGAVSILLFLHHGSTQDLIVGSWSCPGQPGYRSFFTFDKSGNFHLHVKMPAGVLDREGTYEVRDSRLILVEGGADRSQAVIKEISVLDRNRLNLTEAGDEIDCLRAQ